MLVRERSNNLYTVPTYYIAKYIMDMPHLFIGNALFGLIIYLSVRLNENYSYKYYAFLGLVNYLGFAGSAFGYWVGTLARTTEALTVLNPVRIIFKFR